MDRGAVGDLLGMGERSDRKIIDAKTACIPCFYDYKEGGRLGVYGLGVGDTCFKILLFYCLMWLDGYINTLCETLIWKGKSRKTLLKNWCFWTVALETTLGSPLDYKEIKPVNLKGNQPWLFIGRTDAEAEAPILWPPDVKNWLIGKDPDAGKDWRQEEKGTTKNEMVGWHHWLNGHEFEQAPGVGDQQGGLACCSP